MLSHQCYLSLCTEIQVMSTGTTSARINYSTYPFIYALHPGDGSYLAYINMYDSDLENSPEAISVAATCKNITVLLAIGPAPSCKKR